MTAPFKYDRWPSSPQPTRAGLGQNRQAVQITGIAIGVVGVLIAVLILVLNSGGDDDDAAQPVDTTSQPESSMPSSDSSDEPSSDTAQGQSADIASGLPSDFPVPDGLSVDASGADGYWIATFISDDPEAVYLEWKLLLSDAGYEITGDAFDDPQQWSFLAENDTSEAAITYGPSGGNLGIVPS